jgi:hypothetical protein
MAIQTGGFQVRQMPTYVAPDPRLAAFNPSLVANGMGQAFQLAQQVEEIKRSKALAAELEATRTNRLAAQNAQNLATATVAGPQSQLDLSKIALAEHQVPQAQTIGDLTFAYQERMIPEQGKLGVLQRGSALTNEPYLAGEQRQKAALGISRAAGEQTILPDVLSAEAAKARQTTAEANVGTNLAGAKGSLVAANISSQLKDLSDAESVGSKKLEVLKNKLDDELENAKDDADRDRIYKNFKIDESAANAENLRAHGKALGAGKASDPVVILSKFHTMQNQIMSEQTKLLQTKVPDPNGDGQIPLAAYISNTRDPNTGTVGTERTGFLWLNKSGKKTNSEAEKLIDQLKNLSVQLNQVQGKTSEYFQSGLLADQGIVNPSTPQGASLAVKPGTVPVIVNKAQFDAFKAANPPRTKFIGADGKPYYTP